MSNIRSIFVFSILFLLTLCGHFLLRYHGTGRRSHVQSIRFVSPSVEKAFRISVVREGSPKTELVCTRRWRMIEPYPAVADENVILKMTDALISTEIEAVTSEQDLLKLGRTRNDFGLENPKLKVALTDAAGTTEISFGMLTPANDGYYAAVSGKDVVYVVPTNTFLAANLSPEGFRRRSVFSVGPDAAIALDVKQGSGSFMRFTREGEWWKMVRPKEASASPVQLKKLIDGVMTSSAADFIWPTGATNEPNSATAALLAGYGLDPESAVTVSVKCSDDTDRQISFGSVAKEGFVYALIHHATAIVTVPEELKELASAGISDFTDMRVFPVSENSISGVSVTDGETKYLLSRNETGAWIMESPVNAATDPARVSQFISRIISLKTTDCSSNGVGIAVIPGDKAMTFPREKAFGSFRLESLRNLEIVRIEPSDVRRIVLANDGNEKPTSVVHDSDRRVWNVEESQKTGVVSEEAVGQLLLALNPLNAEEIVKLKVSASDLRNYGLDNPSYTIAIDLRKEDSLRRNILIGRRVKGGRYATLGSSDAVFVLAEETVNRLTSSLLNER